MMDQLCDLCEEVFVGLVGGAQKRFWRNLFFHPACFNAIRCHQRLISKNAVAKQASENKFQDDLDGWRADIVPLISGEPRGRNVAAFHAARSKVVSQDTFQETAMEEGELLLTKIRYKAFMRHWEAHGYHLFC